MIVQEGSELMHYGLGVAAGNHEQLTGGGVSAETLSEGSLTRRPVH